MRWMRVDHNSRVRMWTSCMRPAKTDPETAVSAATVQVAVEALAKSATTPVRMAPTAKPDSAPKTVNPPRWRANGGGEVAQSPVGTGPEGSASYLTSPLMLPLGESLRSHRIIRRSVLKRMPITTVVTECPFSVRADGH